MDASLALRPALDAQDGAVATLGDVLAAAIEVAPRGGAGLDVQFFSTVATDEVAASLAEAIESTGAPSAAVGDKRRKPTSSAARNSPALTPGGKRTH